MASRCKFPMRKIILITLTVVVTLAAMAFHEIHSDVHIVSDMVTRMLYSLRYFSNEKFSELLTTLSVFHIATFSAVIKSKKKIVSCESYISNSIHFLHNQRQNI